MSQDRGLKSLKVLVTGEAQPVNRGSGRPLAAYPAVTPEMERVMIAAPAASLPDLKNGDVATVTGIVDDRKSVSQWGRQVTTHWVRDLMAHSIEGNIFATPELAVAFASREVNSATFVIGSRPAPTYGASAQTGSLPN
jgi:hypothetical protein